MRPASVTTVAVEEQEVMNIMTVCACVCVCECGRARARARVSVLLPLPSVMQIASLLHRIILSSGAYLVPQYFSILSHKRHDVRNKKFSEHKMSFFSTTLICTISHSKKN
jgi:hypothetical protein